MGNLTTTPHRSVADQILDAVALEVAYAQEAPELVPYPWITFALERGVPIATVCNNCDTSIKYIQEHYFHYDAKRATEALSTGRKGLKAAVGKDRMRDPYLEK